MDYINQIFYEGLGKSIYVPLENKIKKINNKKIINKLIIITKVMYMIIALLLAIILFKIKL